MPAVHFRLPPSHTLSGCEQSLPRWLYCYCVCACPALQDSEQNRTRGVDDGKEAAIDANGVSDQLHTDAARSSDDMAAALANDRLEQVRGLDKDNVRSWNCNELKSLKSFLY